MRTPLWHYLGLAGVIGPLLFVASTLLCASLRPSYSHTHQFISELGATGTPNAGLMNFLGFICGGSMIALFGIALMVSIRQGRKAVIGSGLIILFGLGILMSGIFSCDPGCPDVGSVPSNIHQRIAPIAFLSAILGIFLLGMAFRRSHVWKSFWVYSVISAVLAFGFLLALVNTLETRLYTGIWQRLLLMVLFLWVIVTGYRLFYGIFKIKEASANDN